MAKSIIRQIKNSPQYKYSQTRWNMVQIFLTSSLFSFSIFAATASAAYTLYTEGHIAMMWIIGSVAVFFLLLGIGLIVFLYKIAEYWLSGETQDPIPTKDDVRKIIKEENKEIIELLSQILKQLKENKR